MSGAKRSRRPTDNTMSLRSRTATQPWQKEAPGVGPSSPPEGRQRRSLSLAVRVAIVAAVVLINLLIYANLGYFKAYAPSSSHNE